ncbi:radical SAM protein, partial [bacterium]|nr:radical SAM protein [bacterium]
YLEISNICNLSCSFCSDHHRPFRTMTLQEINQALDQIKEVTDYVYLHLKGEPLLHPDFNEILASIKNKLYTLPGQTEVYPGHGKSTTIEWEIEHNSYI